MKDCMKKRFTLLTLAAMLLLLPLLWGTASSAASSKTSFPKKATVMVGEKAELSLAGNTGKAVYSSSDPKIVKIVKSSKTKVTVKAQKAGAAKIKAKVGQKTYTCTVTASPLTPEATVTAGETVPIKLLNASGSVKWSSSNPSVVKIQKKDRKGATLKGVSAGKAVVIAKVGKAEYSCSVTVRKPLSMKSELTLTAGKTASLSLKNNTEKALWSTSDKSVVKIQSKNNSGAVLKGVSAGTAKITVKVGKKSLTCKVKVKKKVSLTSKATVTMGKTKEITLKNNTAKVTWSSSDKAVVKLTDKSTGRATLKGVAPGTATVTAKIGKDSYTCAVTVVEPKYSYEITPMLSPFNRYFYVKTEDPDVSDIAFLDKTSVSYSADSEPDRLTLCTELFLDVKYEKEATARVKGGYIFRSENGTTDGGSLTLQTISSSAYSWDKGYTDTARTVKCPKVKTRVQYLIDTYTKKAMTFFEKLDAVEQGLYSLALYPRSTLDTTKPNENTPYPLLTVSPYAELGLNEWYLLYDYSEDGLLLNRLYPFVLDSLGFPNTMAAVAKQLEPACTVAQGFYHYLVDVTFQGETKSYGGAGAGDSDPLKSSRVKKLFRFDQSSDDYSAGASLEKLAGKYKEYGEIAAKDTDVYREQLTGDTYARTIGMGSWIRVGTEGWNLANQSYAYVTQDCPYDAEHPQHPYSVENTWVDGRYVNKWDRFEQGATFADYPTADILIRNMTYTDKWGKSCCGDVTFSYDSATDTWVSNAYTKTSRYSWYSVDYEEIPDNLILTQKEVKALKVDRNTNLLPTSGYIYDGSAEPGTPF